MINHRAYQHPQEVARLCTFLGHMRSATTGVHYLHPGDLSWQLFHMLADYSPADLVDIWEDRSRTILGFVLRFPAYGGFELQLHPQQRQGLLTPDLLQWIERTLPGAERFSTLVDDRDAAYGALLAAQGYQAQGTWHAMERALTDLPLSMPLPAGFSVRSLTSDHEAPQRAAVLAAAFDAPAFPERYQQFMHAPEYVRDLDVVAVAPTGQFAAFALAWVDPVSRVGQFEPVGTAPAYRRQGLGQAVLREGLRRMQQHGADRAIVIVEAAEIAAVNLYTAVGFRIQSGLTWYTKAAAR